MRPKLVAKFGGTSLSTPKSWNCVLDILEQRRELSPLVVVSAVGSVPGRAKITDLLEALARQEADLSALREIHGTLLAQLKLPADLLEPLWHGLTEQLGRLGKVPLPEALDGIMGWGERLSAEMMAAALRQRGWQAASITPQDLGLLSSDHFQNASILENGLDEIVRRIFSAKTSLVVPGYIGVTADGRPTTLGRGGSDYTAAVLGAALKREVEIWTDVDGVAVSNPNLLPQALRMEGHPVSIPQLSHEEAYQMAAFGSKVLYQKCLAAAHMASRRGRHLRLVVKNTFHPDHPGTVMIGHSSPDGRPKGITALEGVQLLTVYLADEEDYRGLLQQVDSLSSARLLMASYSTGRASFVFDALTPEVTALENSYPDAHLSKDQVLIKVVGDAMGENHSVLATIHHAIDQLQDEGGVPVIHKSPQLLTDSTFECVALKRHFKRIILQLYRDLFLTDRVQVGLLGVGTVGSGVLYYASQLFSPEKTGFQVNFPIAAVRDASKVREHFSGTITTHPEDVVTDPRVDIVVELMGGLEPARTLILRALAEGKQVVTANKAVLAEHGQELLAAARKHNRNLAFEASVCGEIPVIDVVSKMPSSQDVESFTAIMNGTSNYLLTMMSQGQDYEEALAGAQAAGFAEADPYMDVSGSDAAQKLSILASLVFHTGVNWKSIHRTGIDRVRSVDMRSAKAMGMAIRPVSMARRSDQGLELWVGPALVKRDHSLYAVSRETNAVALQLSGRDEPFTMMGKGAGSLPTARSVVRDILEVARKARFQMVELPDYHRATPIDLISPDEFVHPWWVRFSVQDRPGVFGKVAGVLGDHELSIREASQQEPDPSRPDVAHIGLALKPRRRGDLEAALEALGRFDWLEQVLVMPLL